MTKNKGQIALIVLIVSAISLTLGLALSERVTTDVSTDKDSELLQTAYNAAESGIENYIAQDQTTYASPDNNSRADVSTQQLTGTLLDFGQYVPQDDYAYFWLVNHTATDAVGTTYYTPNTINLCFNNFGGAIAVYYFYLNGSTYGVTRKVYNLGAAANGVTGATTPTLVNNLCGTGYGTGIQNFDISTGNPLLVVIRPINGGSYFGIQGTQSFPSQGEVITSTGTAGNASTTLSYLQRWDVSVFNFEFMLEGMVAEGNVSSE